MRYLYEVSVTKRDTEGKAHSSGAFPIRGHLGFRFSSARGDYTKSIVNTIRATMRAIKGIKITDEDI